MDRPPPRTPQRRWWHRYAVLEVRHSARTMRVVSWHYSRYGASSAAVQMIYDFIDDPVSSLDDDRDWIVRPADRLEFP